MGVHLIIDGYNLAHACGLVSGFGGQDLEQAREELCQLLASYKKVKAHKITVVFDAQHAPDYETRRDRIRGIAVQYSPHGRLADSVIKNMARKEREKAIVVTSDNDVAGAAAACGAAAVSCQEFQARLMDVMYGQSSQDPDDTAMRRTDTCKKGPGRREKKQRRRTARKAEKL